MAKKSKAANKLTELGFDLHKIESVVNVALDANVGLEAVSDPRNMLQVLLRR